MFELKKDKPIRWRTKRKMSFLLVSHKDGSSLYVDGWFDPKGKTIYWCAEAKKGSFTGGFCRRGKLPITVGNTCGRWRKELCAEIISAVTTMFWESWVTVTRRYILPHGVSIPFIRIITEDNFAEQEWKRV